MLLFSPNWLFLYPGLVLMLAGFLLGAKLLASPVYIKGVRLSVDTLIYSVTMIEVGFQAVLFALLSRAYAVQEGLFPTPPKRNLFDSIFSLERGIILGSVLILLVLCCFSMPLAFGGAQILVPSTSKRLRHRHRLVAFPFLGVRNHPLDLLAQHVEAERQNHFDDGVDRNAIDAI